MIKNFFLPFVLSFGGSSLVEAQDSRYRTWAVLNFNQNLGKNFVINSDFQYRAYEDLDKYNQLLFRAGLGYHLASNNHTVLLGYAYVSTKNPINNNDYFQFDESRIYQQYNFKHQYSRLNFVHRVRLEERLIDDKDLEFRFRYQFNLSIPINNKKLETNSYYVKFSNELFLQAVENKTFDRNRANVNLGYVISPQYSIEAGYMRQDVKNDFTDHLMLGLTINNLF